MSLQLLRTEYFVLKDDVINPHPDRRSSRFVDRETWPKGSRIQKRVWRHHDTNNVVEYTGFGTAHSFDQAQSEAIQPALEPAPKAIGQILHQKGVSADSLLAMLIQKQCLRLDTVEVLCSDIDAIDEDERIEFERLHWL